MKKFVNIIDKTKHFKKKFFNIVKVPKKEHGIEHAIEHELDNHNDSSNWSYC